MGRWPISRSSQVRQRHILVDVAGFAAGTFAVDAFVNHHWSSIAAGLILIAVLVIEDKISIRNEISTQEGRDADATD